MIRSKVMKQFGLSVNHGAAYLNGCIGLAPNSMICDKSVQTYVRGPEYAAQFQEPNANGYFAQLRSLADGLLDGYETCIADRPAYDAGPAPARGVKPTTLRSVVGTIHSADVIEVMYHIFLHSESNSRWIVPHAIGLEGFPLHIWAFCTTDEVFRNFLLSRILQTRGAEANGATNVTDADWKGHVANEIAPTLDSPKVRRK